MTGRAAWNTSNALLFILLLLVSELGFASGDSAPPQKLAGHEYLGQEIEEVGTRGELRSKFLSNYPDARVHRINVTMNAYDDRTPAGLRLNTVWVSHDLTMVEIEGLPVSGRSSSAVIHEGSFSIRSKGLSAKLLAVEGVIRVRDRSGGDALIVKPGEKLLAIFEVIDDINPFSISHRLKSGQEFVYFKDIDPRFTERYQQSARRAMAEDASPEQMRDFIVDFARNDPQGKVREVFSKLLRKMRAENTFEGYWTAYQLTEDPKDFNRVKDLAVTNEQKSIVFEGFMDRYKSTRSSATLEIAKGFIATESSREKYQMVLRAIEEEKLAETRTREQARLAEQQRIAEARRVEEQAAAERRCLSDPSCRQEYEQRQAACVQSIQACRGQCDQVAGVGRQSSFFGGLAAAGMARVCYSGCKCDGGFGNLLARFNNATSGGPVVAAPVDAGKARGSSVSERAPPGKTDVSAQATRNWRCSIYCVNRSGPIIFREIQAPTRRDAAKLIEANASNYCSAAGHKYASDISYAEGQCVQK